MEPKHYKATAALRFRVVDVTLTFGVMLSIGELSGEDIELLYEIREKLREAEPPVEQFVPAQRHDEAFSREVDLELKTSHVQFMLQMLYGKLRCFAAGDMDHVMEIRQRLKDCLKLAER